jgi:hypothetical protein
LNEGLTNQTSRHTKSLGDKRVHGWSERWQRSGESRLHQHAERATHGNAAGLRHLPPGTFVDEKQIGLDGFGQHNRCCLPRIEPELDFWTLSHDDADPLCLTKYVDARGIRLPFDDFGPDWLGHDHTAE